LFWDAKTHLPSRAYDSYYCGQLPFRYAAKTKWFIATLSNASLSTAHPFSIGEVTLPNCLHFRRLSPPLPLSNIFNSKFIPIIICTICTVSFVLNSGLFPILNSNVFFAFSFIIFFFFYPFRNIFKAQYLLNKKKINIVKTLYISCITFWVLKKYENCQHPKRTCRRFYIVLLNYASGNYFGKWKNKVSTTHISFLPERNRACRRHPSTPLTRKSVHRQNKNKTNHCNTDQTK